MTIIKLLKSDSKLSKDLEELIHLTNEEIKNLIEVSKSKIPFKSAAYVILRLENRPMTSREITEIALQMGILETKGKTPHSTMSARLYCDIIDKKEKSRFMKFGPDLFGLREWEGREDIKSLIGKRKGPKEIKPKDVNVDDFSMLQKFKKELENIKTFIENNNPSIETNRLCFWVWFCYTFGFYREGALIFRRIEKEKVQQDFYSIVRIIGEACELNIGQK